MMPLGCSERHSSAVGHRCDDGKPVSPKVSKG
jgi:hypothetical protein